MKSIVQIGSAPSVASLRQRVGRSGRRGEPAVLRMVAVEDPLEPRSSLADALRLDLVQCIAMLQLMAEGWCEPPIDNALHLSTLVQQVLSVIVQRGGASVSYLNNLLVNKGPFRSVGQERFLALLRAMKARELVEQMEDGTLLVGRVGERLTEHYSFFAAFATPEEYRLIANGRSIGTMPLTVPLKSGDPLLFAGRRWQVVTVDEEHSTIYLQPGHGKRPPRFLGDGAWLDRRVRETMRKVFTESNVLPYLDETARGLLAEGRYTFNEVGLAESPILDRGQETMIFHWSGDREAGTLRLLMEHFGLSVDPGLSYLTVESGVDNTLAKLGKIASDPLVDPFVLAGEVQNKGKQKYDWVLSDDLAAEEYACGALDVPGAVSLAQRLLDQFNV